MRKTDLINKISSKKKVRSVKSMQLLDEQSSVYFNFINSLNSEATKKSYKFCIEKFLGYYKLDLELFLKLPQEEMFNFIIKYLVNKKISKKYKDVVIAPVKHACEINDVILNWESKSSFGDKIKVRPVNFSTEHKNMLSNLHAIISKGYLSIESKNDKLLTLKN